MTNTQTLLTVRRLTDSINAFGGYYVAQANADTDHPAFVKFDQLVDLIDSQKHHAFFCNVARMKLGAFNY